MQKLNATVLFSAIAIMAASSAFANEPTSIPTDKPVDVPPETPALTWNQFKEACAHPEQFHIQMPPTNIRIQCTSVSTQFVPAAAGTVPVTQSQRVTSAVFSSKFHVDGRTEVIPLPEPKGGSCLKYKEVEKTVTIESSLSCKDVLGLKSDLAEYCASLVSLNKGSNPKLAQSRDTGTVLDTCRNAVIYKGNN